MPHRVVMKVNSLNTEICFSSEEAQGTWNTKHSKANNYIKHSYYFSLLT